MTALQDLPSLLIKLYEDQITLLHSQIEQLRNAQVEPSTNSYQTNGAQTADKGKKPKKEKGPKRPPNAYNLFLMDTLKSMKEENRQFAPSEVMSIVSKEWSQLDAKAKSDYSQRASVLKTQSAPSSDPAGETTQEKKPKASTKKKPKAAAEGGKALAEEVSSPLPMKPTVQVHALPVPDTPVSAVKNSQFTQPSVEESEKKKKKKKKKHHRSDEDEPSESKKSKTSD